MPELFPKGALKTKNHLDNKHENEGIDPHKNQNKLGAYLTVGPGAGCQAGTAGAATVTFYGANAQPPTGIGFSGGTADAVVDDAAPNGSVFHQNNGSSNFAYFTRGEDKNWGANYNGEAGQFRSGGLGFTGPRRARPIMRTSHSTGSITSTRWCGSSSSTPRAAAI
jgi:hypothetical protein